MILTRRRSWVLAVVAAIVLAMLGVVLTRGDSADAKETFKLPAVKHVWVIVLENEDYAHTFGDPKADPYLARTLPAKGALLTKYWGTGHNSNDNYISMISGQPPNPLTQSDCQTFTDFLGGSVSKGIETGSGCVYPSQLKTIADQLNARGKSWKAYQQDMGNDPSREAAACGHPDVGSIDNTEKAEQGDGYATRHNPFMYFHSVIDNAAYCRKHVVALGTPKGKLPASAIKGETGLATDLKSAATTPAYSFVTPNLCMDGHDYPCKNQKGGASALADIDSFLSIWVPKIMSSAAYKQGGLIEITFDESDGAKSDSTSCCGETPGPASPLPGVLGPGGGKVGALLLSPYIKAGTVSNRAYNHYSLLASDEKLFGLPALGDARDVPRTFGADIFTK